MANQRLVEHIIATSTGNTPYKLLSEKELPKKVKESYNNIQKNLLKESTKISSVKKVREGIGLTGIVDNLSREDFPDTYRIWKFPISRYDCRNANNRIYTKELWEKVINEQKDSYQKSVGLADHPSDDSDGSVKDIAIVWYDIEIDEANKLIWGYGSFVGIYGHQVAEDVVNHGGKIGFSSSGFGDVLADGTVVDYILERPADIVLNPSQSVFGSYKDDHNDTQNIEYTKQQVKNIGDNMENQVNESVQKVTESTKQPVTTTEKLTENSNPLAFASAVDFVNRQIEELNKIENPAERMTEAYKLKVFVTENMENKEVADKIDALLAESQLQVTEAVKESLHVNELLKGRNIDEAIQDSSVAKDLLEKLGKHTTDIKAVTESLLKRLNSVKAENKELQEENKKLRSLNASKDERFKEAMKSAAASEDELKRFYESKSRVSNRKVDRKIAESDKAKSLVKESLRRANTTISTLRKENLELKESNKALKNKLSESVNVILDLKKSYKINEGKNRKLCNIVESQAQAIKEDNKFIPQEVSTEKAMKTLDEGILKQYIGNNNEVEVFYNGLYEKYGPSVEAYKQRILECNTYSEAFTVFLENRENIDKKFAKARYQEDTSVSRLAASLIKK